LENLQLGRKTLWANIGSNQFHLSEGSPDAQILDGCITTVYPSLNLLKERYNNIMNNNQNNCLKESKFNMIIIEENDEAALMVTDPWGTNFRIVEEDKRNERDNRGSQQGEQSEGIGISDLTIHVPMNCNLDGIGRFYRDILGAELVDDDDDDDAHQENDKKMKMVQIRMGPFQTLTFVSKEFVEVDTHVDLRELKEDRQGEKSSSTTVGNYGIHISIYVADLPSCYQRANEIGVTYVSTRFSRQVYTIDDAIDQCMFRCLDIIDPLNVEDGPILKLEHEIRSVIKRDGTKYISCPFDTIPDGCITL
jgi:catechol 2,3-dioxygenase-like lactoylglutathione lyase family enzyme